MSPSFRRSVALVYFTSLLQGAFGVTLPASSVVLRQRLRLGDVSYGGLFLLLFLVALAASLSGTRCLRRWSLKQVHLFGLGAEALALGGIALAGLLPSPWGHAALLLAVVLGGAAIGALGISLNTAAIELFPASRGGALSALHGLLGAGAAVWPMVVAGLTARGFWTAAPFALAAAFAMLFLAGATRPVRGLAESVEETPPRTDLPARLRWRALTAFLYGAGEAIFTVWAVVLLYERRQLPLAVAAGALSAFWLAMTGGRLLAAVAVRRIGAGHLAVALAFGMSASFLLVAGSRGALGSLFAFGAAGFCCSALFPLLFALASHEYPERTPQVSAVFSAAVLAGLALGSFGVGPVRGVLGLERIYLLGSLVPLVMMGILLRLREGGRRLPVSERA